MKVGYIRVSTKEQLLDRQIDALVKEGVDSRNIYQDIFTGTKRNRDGLNKMIAELQEGDVIYINDLTRLSRSTKDLFIILDEIKCKGAKIKSLKDTWLDTTDTNPYGDFLLTVMAGLNQLERDLISQRTQEGLASARARGRFGGRPNKRNDKADIVIMMLNNNYRIKDIVEKTGLSRATVYRIKNENIN